MSEDVELIHIKTGKTKYITRSAYEFNFEGRTENLGFRVVENGGNPGSAVVTIVPPEAKAIQERLLAKQSDPNGEADTKTPERTDVVEYKEEKPVMSKSEAVKVEAKKPEPKKK